MYSSIELRAKLLDWIIKFSCEKLLDIGKIDEANMTCVKNPFEESFFFFFIKTNISISYSYM